MKFETLLLSEACFLALRLAFNLDAKEKELITSILLLILLHPAHSNPQDIGFITHAQRIHSQFSTKSAIN